MKVTLLLLIFAVNIFTKVSCLDIYPPKYAYMSNSVVNANSKLGITKGVEVQPHSIPYQVYFVAFTIDNHAWSCGGSLITESYVLTAAHCVDGAIRAEVHIGCHDLSKFEKGSVEINSRALIVHEQYDDAAIDNDIGLIQLDGEVFPSETINYARLPSRSAPSIDLVGQSGRTSGWGLTDGVQESTTYVLMEANDTVIPNLQCDAVFGTVRDQELCLSGVEGSGPCRGDTGGPLVIGNLLEGIFSYGNKFCIPQYPTVFVRVRSFLDWIETHSNWRSS